jgi:uronate dehydrogenase
MTKILLTGAAGIVGKALRPILAEKYPSIVLTDLVEITDLSSNETFVQGDITDLSFVKKLVQGVSGIVHLAAMVGHYSFDEVLGPNFVGTYNIYEASRMTDIPPRVIFASSHHAVGFFKRGEQAIDHRTAPRPDSFYGLSKAYGEGLASLYADKYSVKTLSIRIGYVGENVPDERRMHTWISASDLYQLIEIGFTVPDLHHEIVYGVSQVPEPFFDNSNACRLGYKPQDLSTNYLLSPDIEKVQPGPDSFIGGSFATSEV